ncbi:hypothetical protein FACS189427_02800 [Planctomycetales bacterium]|nr:hypothetical protein FACS189427_02800 [Planctomycetales bacterium]
MSVFAVRTGFDSLQIAWGSEGRFIEGDVKEQRIGTGSAGSDYYVQKVGDWARVRD